jgi:hypothetical protein
MGVPVGVFSVALDTARFSVHTVFMQTEPLPYVEPSESELFERSAERTIQDLSERLAMRNARCAELTVALERMVEMAEAGDVTPRVIAGARKILGLDYDHDALNEYGEGF